MDRWLDTGAEEETRGEGRSDGKQWSDESEEDNFDAAVRKATQQRDLLLKNKRMMSMLQQQQLLYNQMQDRNESSNANPTAPAHFVNRTERSGSVGGLKHV